MKFMYFSIKYRYSDIVLKKHRLHLLQSHSLLCWHGFCYVDKLNPDNLLIIVRQRHVIKVDPRCTPKVISIAYRLVYT